MSVSRDERGEVEPFEPRRQVVHRAGNQEVVAVVGVYAGPYIIEDLGLGRSIDLTPLRAVVDHAMRRR